MYYKYNQIEQPSPYMSNILHEELRVVQMRFLQTLVPASRLQVTILEVSVLLLGNKGRKTNFI